MLLAEIQALRRAQEEMLELLRGSVGPAATNAFPEQTTDGEALEPPSVRARRRKTVLLLDDDPATRDAAQAALTTAEVPLRVVSDGRQAIAAIAEEKPDVIVIELEARGSVAGKDVVNMIKATMEWVDIPIVLWTRATIESQKEARTIHGADEYVLKSQGAEALVSRVILVFRKG
jgi:DNA-binding response OmpR family regulator